MSEIRKNYGKIVMVGIYVKGGNFLWRMKLKKLFSGFTISHALWTIFCFLSHVHLRPFSFILNPKAVKCLHTFEIQNTANVVAMDETAIYDYSSVRICLNANIPTFLFINRWCKAKKPSLMRGITIHKHSTTGSTF